MLVNRNGNGSTSVLLVAIMLLAGCSGQVDDPEQQVVGCTDEAGINYNPDATISDNSSCTYGDVAEEETGGTGEGEAEQDPPISVPHTDGCDNTNPIHCMLPFPSDAFLRVDEGTETGLRIHFSANSIPGSGLSPVVEIPILNSRDGVSPSTQIMTAFASEPDVSDLAGQYTIEKSLDPSHPTLLLNLETMALVPHWVELDARSEPDQSTILHIRTIQALEHNTPFAVVIRDLVDSHGESIPAHEGFAAPVSYTHLTLPTKRIV